MPSPRIVLMRVWESGMAFVVRAGTLIFATSVLVWAAGSFPGSHARQYELTAKIESLEAEDEEANAATIEELSGELNLQNSQLLQGSFLGRAGKAIEPSVKPLGWDWRIGIGDVDHGLLRFMRSMCVNSDGHSSRNQQLALASVFIRLHDGSGLR